jgi:predicted DNA-binding protein (MmcQ/YjbR family)
LVLVPPAIDADGDLAALARIRAICARLPGAEEGVLQDRPLFHVRRRRFAIFNGATSPLRPRWRSSGRSLHFLGDPEERAALRQDARFRPSPHHGDRGWFAIQLDDDGVDWDEIAELLAAAHEAVTSARR